MKKIFLIGWKDVLLAFRDRAALIMMLLAPFALTIGMGAVTGRFSGSSSSGISNIPIVVVNQDGQRLGNALVDLFQSNDLNGLVKPTISTDVAAARRLVDEDKAAAVVIVPAGFTRSVFSVTGDVPGAVVQLQLYTNPTAPTSVGIIKTILEDFLGRVETGRVSGRVAVSELIKHGLIQVSQAAQVGEQIGVSQADSPGQNTLIKLNIVTNSGAAIGFDILAYMAPGMALMFLMFTVSNGGRSLLAERSLGTLPRLLVTPTSGAQILAGKIFGIFLTGTAQMLILILSSTLFFQLKWGDPLGVLVIVLAAVFGASGWGMILTALAKTPGQVGAAGSALMLIFGILGGSFISLDNFPGWFRAVSKITPNAWGLDGFSTLAAGGTLADIGVPVLALLVMGALLFAVALFLFNRKGLTQA
jgi:ABC-2 type transport system permease protein